MAAAGLPCPGPARRRAPRGPRRRMSARGGGHDPRGSAVRSAERAPRSLPAGPRAEPRGPGPPCSLGPDSARSKCPSSARRRCSPGVGRKRNRPRGSATSPGRAGALQLAAELLRALSGALNASGRRGRKGGPAAGCGPARGSRARPGGRGRSDVRGCRSAAGNLRRPLARALSCSGEIVAFTEHKVTDPVRRGW